MARAIAREAPGGRSSQSTGLPDRVLGLLREASWIFRVTLAMFLGLILLTYDKADPGWSHAVAARSVANAGGRVGAWFADLLLYLFGASAGLLVVALLVGVIRSYRELHPETGGDPASPGQARFAWERWIGFIVFFASCVALESSRLHSLPISLPLVPGGVVGELLSTPLFFGFGAAGGTLALFFGIAAGFSLWSDVSWLSVFECIGLWLELGFLRMRDTAAAWRDRRAGAAAAVAREEHVVSKRRHADGESSAAPAPSTEVTPVSTTSPSSSTAPSVRSARIEPSLDTTPAMSDDALPWTLAAAASNHAAPSGKQALGPRDDPADGDWPDEPPTRTEAPGTSALRTGAGPSPSQASAAARPSGPSRRGSGNSLPDLSLLEPPPLVQEQVPRETLEFTSRLIEKKLADFNVSATVASAYPGPVITRYEIEPATGVKGSQIVGLSKDLARALSLVSLRVVETIPGKNLMGLELPNPRRQAVRLSEILGASVYTESQSSLTMALGKDIAGKPVVADLARMPHVLVAGTTGSGKSVGVNAMLLSLLYKSDPTQVRLILIDPKMLELAMYEGIPHLLAPVVTDMRHAGNALNWCVAEMERRYRLMSKLGVRNLAGYNARIADATRREELIPNPFSLTPDAPEPLQSLPQIVVVIDEFADLMMVVGKKVEELIARLAQKARAAGIHLILATQRPSVDVITGLIKANIPTRIAFQVSSKIDSRTILDQMGAESLLGQGDMLYMPPGSGVPMRVHGAFVADDEVQKVVDHWRSVGEPDYIDGILEGGLPEQADTGSAVGFGGLQRTLSEAGVDAEADPMYDQAVAVVLANRRASISLVQRHLHIGYNRSARLLEQMEKAGLVSAMGNNGNREILVPESREQ